MQDPISDMGKGALWIGVPTGIILGLGFVGAGTLAWKRKNSSINEIKQQAVEVQQTVPVLPDPDTIANQNS